MGTGGEGQVFSFFEISRQYFMKCREFCTFAIQNFDTKKIYSEISFPKFRPAKFRRPPNRFRYLIYGWAGNVMTV
jgi:hypothetical protein